MIKTLWDILRRYKMHEDDTKRTRISTPVWRRAHQVVSPERDLSEWVYQVAERDWDTVVKGTNRRVR